MALAANEAGYQVKYLPAEHGHEDADALVGTCVERMVAGIVTLNCDYLRHHNAQPNPFIWTAKAADILAKVTRAKAALVMSQN